MEFTILQLQTRIFELQVNATIICKSFQYYYVSLEIFHNNEFEEDEKIIKKIMKETVRGQVSCHFNSILLNCRQNKEGTLLVNFDFQRKLQRIGDLLGNFGTF